MSQENNFIPNQQNYKPLTPFQLFVKSNFPFIENTFEALDNYGLYCKIVEYLNTVIENENTVESNVQELYDAFVSLNTYVSDYFDNLDVQEEINNKLDEMAEDGTLDEVIEEYFDPKFASLQSQINSLASGAPLSASSTAGMTDTSRIYVNTSDGYWYYYNGTQWTRGEVYQATILSVDYKNEQTATITTERSVHTYDLIAGHTYRFFNTSTVANLTVSSREPDQVTAIETFVTNLSHGRYIEFVPTQTTNCLFIVANDLTSTSYKIVDLDTIDERITDNKDEIENFTLNNLSDLARKYFTKGYLFKEITKYFQKVAITQNNVVTLVSTDDLNCFSIILDLEDFTNSLHVALQTSKFDTPTYRYYLVKEDNTNNLHNWSAIEGDIFMSLTKEQLETLTTAGWKYIYMTIANSTDGTFLNDAPLPLEFDFYVYDTKPDEATRFNNIIIVDPNGNGDYETIAEAVSAASNYDTIYIRKGTYIENIECIEKTLYFIGEDKYETILQSTDGTYANPPLEIACGIVKNMTINAVYVSGTSVLPESGSPRSIWSPCRL